MWDIYGGASSSAVPYTASALICVSEIVFKRGLRRLPHFTKHFFNGFIEKKSVKSNHLNLMHMLETFG